MLHSLLYQSVQRRLIKIQNKVTAASSTTSKLCSSITSLLLILSTNRACRKITELDKDTGHVARKTDVTSGACASSCDSHNTNEKFEQAFAVAFTKALDQPESSLLNIEWVEPTPGDKLEAMYEEVGAESNYLNSKQIDYSRGNICISAYSSTNIWIKKLSKDLND